MAVIVVASFDVSGNGIAVIAKCFGCVYDGLVLVVVWGRVCVYVGSFFDCFKAIFVVLVDEMGIVVFGCPFV